MKKIREPIDDSNTEVTQKVIKMRVALANEAKLCQQYNENLKANDQLIKSLETQHWHLVREILELVNIIYYPQSASITDSN